MKTIISSFELHTGLEPKEGHKLLGLGYSTYAQYRSGIRPIPDYIERAIEFCMLLENGELNAQIRKHVFNGKTNG